MSPGAQDVLKWLAVASMVADHVGAVLLPELVALRWVGRLAFPLFALLLAYNVSVRGVSRSRYYLPLLVAGVVAQPFFMLAFNTYELNIMFTLLLGLLVVEVVGRWVNAGAVSRWALPVPALAVGAWFASYGLAGVAVVALVVWALRFREKREAFTVCSLCLVIALLAANGLQPFSLVPVVVIPLLLLVFESVQLPRFKVPRLFFYGFYPAHLAGLVGVGALLGGR